MSKIGRAPEPSTRYTKIDFIFGPSCRNSRHRIPAGNVRTRKSPLLIKNVSLHIDYQVNSEDVGLQTSLHSWN